MLLGEIEISLAKGFCLQAGIDIPLKRQNRLAGVVRGEVWLPVVKAGRVQVSQLVADAHQFANLWRRQLAGNADKLLRVFQQFRLGITRRCQRALIIERFCR